MFIPYVHDYYFIGYLEVEEVVKLDEILEKHGDLKKAVEEIRKIAENDIRIRENAHLLRFMNAEDKWDQASWIILGKDGSRLFDKAVRIDDGFLYKKLIEHMIDKNERIPKCKSKKDSLRKSCLLRGSTIVNKEGVELIKNYLKDKVDLNL